MYAVETGNIRIVNLLLNHPGIDINAKNDEDETALSCAERKGRRRIVKLIRSKMKPQNQQIELFQEEVKPPAVMKNIKFWKAISQGDINEMDSWLDEKGKLLIDINARNEKGDTALIVASENGNLNAVKWLLEGEADISLKDAHGNNALIRAAKKGPHFCESNKNNIEKDIIYEMFKRRKNYYYKINLSLSVYKQFLRIILFFIPIHSYFIFIIFFLFLYYIYYYFIY